MLLSRWFYYLASLPTILLGMRNWPLVAAIFLGLPVPRPWVVKLKDGSRFKVRAPLDIWVIKETCLDHLYERASVKIEDGWTILDIGAGLGDFAISIAKKHRNSLVYAYEPSPESYALLQENLALNEVGNVRAFPYALAGQVGPVRLRIAAQAAVQHRVAEEASGLEGSAIEVPAITLDQAFADLGLERCDYLKMDCEGAEYDILFHTSVGTLRRLRHICLEYHDGFTPFSHADLVRFLGAKGFRVGRHPNPVHPHLGLLCASLPT